MPNLIHILFAIAVGLIMISVIIINLLGKVLDQSEETAPDIRQINQEDRKIQEIQQLPNSQDNKEYNRFEQELDGIYEYLEAISGRDEPKEKIEKQVAVVSKSSNHMEIYQAFDAGETVTDIARNFSKSKGEIELILNLRDRDDRGVAADG